MNPMMQDRQIKLLEEALLDIHKPHVDVLEWGSGGSTVHFTRFLRGNGISYSWLSVEHDRGWQEAVREALGNDADAEVRWIDPGAAREALRAAPMDEYVNTPRTLGRKFDFILVDGRKRRRCLLQAATLLKPGGIVFLHDAQRKYYHCALRAYADSRFLDQGLWRGRLEAVSPERRLCNWANRLYYRRLLPAGQSLRRAKALKQLLRLITGAR